MEYWEFLLQKQGERTWQKIYKPSLEIEEGKYRVVSHSSRNNCDVEVRVTHLDTEAVPPKRRISKRSRRTNSQGLMVVVPYTYFKAGVWEFRCCGDIMSDLLGENWQEIVKLDVLPKTNQETLPSHPATTEKSQTEATKDKEISLPATVSSLAAKSIEISEAPEVESEKELSLFSSQPISFSGENRTVSTEIREESSPVNQGNLTETATSTEETLSSESFESKSELLTNVESESSDRTSITELEASQDSVSLQKENLPGEISISSPATEEINSVTNASDSDFFWEESNSLDSEIFTSETESAAPLSWLSDFEEMRTEDLEKVTSEVTKNAEIDSENESNWSNNVSQTSSESEKTSESQIESTPDFESSKVRETSSESSQLYSTDELNWLREIEVSETSSESEKTSESQIESTPDFESSKVRETSSESNQLDSINELNELSEVESNNVQKISSESQIAARDFESSKVSETSSESNQLDSTDELSWLSEFESTNVKETNLQSNEIDSTDESSWLNEIEVSKSSSELEVIGSNQVESTPDLESNNVSETSSESNQLDSTDELSWLREIESNNVSEISSESEITPESQIESIADLESNNVSETSLESKTNTLAQIDSKDELSWLSEIESKSDEEIAIAENSPQTDTDAENSPQTDTDLTAISAETTEVIEDSPALTDQIETDDLDDSEIFWEETSLQLENKQNHLPTTANSLMEKSLEDLEQILEQTVEPFLAELKAPPNDSWETSTTDVSESKNAETNVELWLSLNQDIFIRNQSEDLAIAGNIERLEGKVGESNFTVTAKLLYQLRDPQSNEILLEKEQVVEEKSLPFSFSDRLEIPPQCQTRLILGEVILQSSSAVVLASQTFTVTADVKQLLNTLYHQNNDSVVDKQLVLSDSLSSKKKVAVLREDFLELTKKTQQIKSTKPSSGQIIPPRLGRSTSEDKTLKSLRLPTFGRSLNLQSNTEIDPENSVDLNLDELQNSVNKALIETNGNGKPKPRAIASQDVTSVENNSENSLQIPLTKEQKDGNSNLPEEEQEIVSEASSLKGAGLSPIADPKPETEIDPAATSSIDSPWDNPEISSSDNSTKEPLQENLFDFPPETETENDAKSSKLVEENQEISPDESFNENFFEENLSDFPAEEITQENNLETLENLATENSSDSGFNTQSKNVEHEFKALKMQARFFSRLNSLATDEQERELLPSESSEETNAVEKEQLASFAKTEPELETTAEIDKLDLDFGSEIPNTEEEINSDQNEIEDETPEFPPEEIEAKISLEEVPKDVAIDETADEIVIEAEDEANFKNQLTSVDTSGLPYPAEVTPFSPKSSVFAQSQWKGEVPTPQLRISEKELTPGEPMRVRVKLSSYPGSVYVKLWIKDRQTRTLLDGPHGLVDLIPNRFGELETTFQMKVPLGSMEICVEAIAISPETQRESHKATLNHVVLPPDELDFSFDDL